MKKIKDMVADGFATKRIANLLCLPENEVKQIIINNNYSLIKEEFTNDKISKIIDLYKHGVSAKSIGIKYRIDKRRVQKWVKLNGLLRNRNDAHRFTEFDQHFFDVIDTEEKAYWLGFFYADCYNCNLTNTVTLSLQINDIDHLKKLALALKLPINKITYTKNNEGYEYYTLKMYSKHLCQTLNEKGCPQAKSFIIKYPDWLSTNLEKSFIRGIFDGDGSICKRESGEWKWSIATTKECGESIQKLILENLKIIVNLRCISKTNHNTYEIESNGNEKVLQLAEWLYKDVDKNIYLNRKYEKYLQLIDQQKYKNTNHLSRDKYVLSDEIRSNILNGIGTGLKMSTVANLNKVNYSTVKRIVVDNESNYDKIAVINNIPVTAKYVKTLDYDQRLELVEPLFKYFRNLGWIYPDNPSKLKSSYNKLCNWNIDINSMELFNNSSLATDICKYFCHKFYEATEEGEPTMIEVFNDDDKLRKLIKNRLGFDWWDKEDNDETFNISFRMLLQGMRSSRLVPSISIFKPNIAKFLYMKYSSENDTVYDYSAGWGGRMLGAASCNRKYIGVDPLTTHELQNMSNYLNLKNIQLIKSGSELVKLTENSIDFSFSSPPYFDQEYYSSDVTQAYNNGEDYFYNEYWANTLDNVKFMLKPNKWFGLNVKNYPKMLQMAIDKFGEPVESISLRTVRSHLNKSAGVEKSEYVYMFKNIK